MRTVILFLLLCLGSFTFLQAQKISKHTVYFDVDKYTLSASEKSSLDAFIRNESSAGYIGNIRITGHTDADASSEYNLKLSENRVKTVAALFEHVAPAENIKKEWLGEDQPLNNNASSEEKKLNRRVEITIDHWVPDLNETKGSIKDLYKILEQKKQIFCIQPKGDTVIRLEQGTILHFPAYPFGKRDVPCIKISAKEIYKKSDMIMENLSTTSNGQLLESAGMIYLEASIGDSLLELDNGKEVLVMMPAETLREDMKGFNGERDPHTDIINWQASTNPMNLLRMPPGDICRNWPNLNSSEVCDRCRFFFCRFKRIDEGLKGIVNRDQHKANRSFRQCQRKLRKSRGRNFNSLPLTEAEILNCQRQDSLFKVYGVNNRDALIKAMNKEQMDKYGVKTLEALQDTLNKIRISNIENNLLSGTINQGELQYYMYNTARLGWINTDAFSKLAGESIAMTTDLKVDPQSDCKAVFKSVRGALPAYVGKEHYEFYNVPKGNEIWLIGLRFKNGQAYISMKKTFTSSSVELAPFKEVSIEDLKKELKKIDQ